MSTVFPQGRLRITNPIPVAASFLQVAASLATCPDLDASDRSWVKKKTAEPKASSQAWLAMKREAIKTVTAARLIPPHPTLRTLREAAAGCKACDLWKTGTQTVFGEGSARATVMFVGEQPGDREDLAGRPFVGPAGKLLDQALAQVGIDRRNVYVTNVVKHFKWVPDEVVGYFEF